MTDDTTAPIAEGEAAPVDGGEEPVADAPKPKGNPEHTRAFRALTLKEREVRRASEALRERETALQTFEAQRSKARQDPDAYLKAAGLTYEDVAKHYLNDGKPAPQDPRYDSLAEENKKLTARVDQFLAAEENRQQQEEVRKYLDGLSTRVDDNQDRWELVHAYGRDALREVGLLIAKHYEASGELLTEDEACDQIEAALEQEKEGEAKRLFATKKMRRKLGLDDPTPDSKESHPKLKSSPTATGTKSITSDLKGSATSTRPSAKTDDDLWRELVARARAG